MNHKLSNKELLQADKNLLYSIQLQVQNLSAGSFLSTDHYFIYSIGIDSTDAHLNGAICLNDQYAEEMVTAVESFFESSGCSYSYWIRDYADHHLERLLQSKKLKANRYPGSAVMFIDQKIEDPVLNDGFVVKKLESRREIKDFAFVLQKSFNKTDEQIKRMFQTDETLLHDDIIVHVIYKNDKPISAAMTVLSKEIAGIYWVGTLEEGRGQGLGSYITMLATNAGFDAGKNRVILQASPLGEPIYERLGYKHITRYRTYTVKKK